MYSYDILDTAPEPAFDHITHLAARLFNTPIAVVSFIDRDRQWFKSRYGLSMSETPRELAFCTYAVIGDEVMVVPDARLDARFAGCPLVTGESGVRFYAGAPLTTREGFNIGTLAVMDGVPRQFSDNEIGILTELAGLVVDELELRRQAGARLVRRLEDGPQRLRERFEQRLRERTSDLARANAALHAEIEEHRKAEESLRASELRYRQSIELSPDAIFIQSNGQIVFVNKRALQLYGATEQQELVGRPVLDLIHPDYREMVQERIRLLALGQEVPRIEEKILRLDGSVVDVEVAAAPLLNYHSTPAAQVVLRDITERKRTEVMLAQLAAIVESSDDAIIGKNLEGIITSWNGGAEQIYGYTADEVVGRSISILMPPECPNEEADIQERLQQGESIDHYETERIRKDGRRITVSLTISPIKDSEGSIIAASTVARDISEEKRMEEALRKSHHQLEHRVQERTQELNTTIAALRDSEARLQFALEVAHMGTWELEQHTERVTGSELHQRLWGLTPGTSADTYQAFLERIHPDDREMVQQKVQHSLRTGEDYIIEYRIIWPDGTVHWLFCRGRVLRDAEDEVVALGGVSLDITERKQAEEQMREQQELLQTIFNHIPAMLSFYDADGKFQYVNREWERVLGWSLVEIKNHPDPLAEFYPDPADLWRVLDFMRRADGEWTDFKTRVRDGRILYTSWTNIRLPDGRRIGLGQDITERKQTEVALHEAKEEAEQANRAKSDFLSRMSHELRTPLNSILGFGQLLEMDDLTDESRDSVEHIMRAGRHLLGLINEVLDIACIEAGQQAFSIEAVHVGQLLRESLDLVRPLATKRRVEIGNVEGEYYVRADQQRLKQVFLNLLGNAIKYNCEDGSVILVCEIEQDQLRIGVSDTGQGMSPEDMQKLFIPFERLQAAHHRIEGTGLGLLVTKRLVEAMHGEIGVESTVGQGSTFWVKLPLTDSPESKAFDTDSDSIHELPFTAPPAASTVLYIEDNLANLKLIERIFEEYPKITLLSAMQGSIGLDLAREHHPDLILLDLHLPDMNGDEVLRRLREGAGTRDIPVVMLSADATPRQIERLLTPPEGHPGAKEYLTKPLNVKQFLSVLKNILQNES